MLQIECVISYHCNNFEKKNVLEKHTGMYVVLYRMPSMLV